LRELYGRIQAWATKLQDARKEYQQLPLDILGELRSEQPEAGTNVSDEARQLAQKAIEKDLKEEELETVVRGDIDARMLTLEANLKNLKPNLQSIEEFRRADAEHKAKLSEYDDVHNQREEGRRNLEILRQKRLEEFMEGFSTISMKLKEMYQMITLGGDAELELVDTLDPFSEGINFSVRPPKKSWKQITNLSGGEKTLASLSLVFALHHYRPTPLYFMDEIDAALDFRNVSIIANYIKERTKNAQFIVISLRNHMFEMADLLVGIYKTQDVSKSVGINPLAFDVSKNSAPIQDAQRAGKRPLPAPMEGPPATARKIGA
jgi:structural maintenance of chromosome 4